MTAVCIAGMHRSGTSMVVRVLNLCGLYLGEENDLLPPGPDNPEDYWENIRFFSINNGLLTDLQGAWDVPPKPTPGWENQPGLLQYRIEAEKLTGLMASTGIWGWKDPQNSLTLAFWRQLIPNLRVIICLRDPNEFIPSAAKRPIFSALHCERFTSTFGSELPLCQQALPLHEVLP